MILRPLCLGMLGLAVASASPGRSFAITAGELDDFNATLEGWGTGAMSGPGYTTHVTTGGPAGVGDSFLRYNADPATTRSKLVGYNQTQWTGNYVAAGVTSISMSLKNLGNTPLNMRLSFGSELYPSAGGEWFTSTVPITLPALSDWMDVSFPIGIADLTAFFDEGTYAAVMGDVKTLRLLHQADVASPYGTDAVEDAFVLGVDNILAVGAAAIPGDFNNSHKVNAADLAKWRTDFAANAGSDANGDQISDGADFLLWQQHFGEGAGSMSVGAISAIPEPSTAGLALCAALAAAVRRRGRRQSA